ncbi:hypothetical protein AKJ64_02125 [candidate division MSBL1 archaeon SCGC-AAA259E17]|uniref:Uncharacterized protein n=1 Tax=candidate division MSBL1 archaeon SCGC-AAA259E17 TaxID=1698263 RepID=A0A133UF77_9EURY|nr:hypothetical protein AKJ64_02125 [candidate division MSBL1 archaeon SCGC-AAA259E17]
MRDMVKVVECELCGKKMSKPPKHVREKLGGTICSECQSKDRAVGDKTAELLEALDETEMDDPIKDPNVLEKMEEHLRSQLELAEAVGNEDAQQQIQETLTQISQDKKELQNKEGNIEKSGSEEEEYIRMILSQQETIRGQQDYIEELENELRKHDNSHTPSSKKRKEKTDRNREKKKGEIRMRRKNQKPKGTRAVFYPSRCKFIGNFYSITM